MSSGRASRAPEGDPASRGDREVRLRAAGYEAVVTATGATLRSLTHHGEPVLAGFAATELPTYGRGQLLLPWPNRVAAGRWTWRGVDRQLPVNEVALGHANHGLVRWSSWTVAEAAEAGTTLRHRLAAQPGYPWTLDLSVRYALGDDGLSVEVGVENLSSTEAPFAAGAHPYVLAGDGPVDDWTLGLPAATALRVDDRMLPIGRVDVAGGELDFRDARTIGATALDTAFTDLTRDREGWAEVGVAAPAGRLVVVRLDRHHRWVQVFAGRTQGGPPRTALAVEPMTAPPDALNSGEDLMVLAPAGEPGARRSVRWGIRVHAGGR